MAGAYPDPPSWRMAWHEDGTQLINLDTGVEMSESNRQSLNNEAGNFTPPNADGLIGLLFPDPINLQAIWINSEDPGTKFVYTSPNTTNGTDGDWTLVASPVVAENNDSPLSTDAWRTAVVTATSLGITGLRVDAGRILNLHLYGDTASGEGLQRVEFWHPTTDAKVSAAEFDWGNVPRQSSETRDFRIKNMSPTMVANDITVSIYDLTTASPQVDAQHLFSADGVHWAATLDAGDVSALSISPIFSIRRVTPSDAQLTTPRWASVLKAEPTSWT